MADDIPPVPPPEPPERVFRPPAPGQVVVGTRSSYRIGQLLGEGAFGATFECSDEWHNDLVVKVLVPRGRTYEQVRLNWEREIATLLTLRHPNITYVFDAFEVDDTFYIVMERCSGPVSTLFRIPNYDGRVWLTAIARCVLQGIHYAPPRLRAQRHPSKQRVLVASPE